MNTHRNMGRQGGWGRWTALAGTLGVGMNYHAESLSEVKSLFRALGKLGRRARRVKLYTGGWDVRRLA